MKGCLCYSNVQPEDGGFESITMSSTPARDVFDLEKIIVSNCGAHMKTHLTNLTGMTFG